MNYAKYWNMIDMGVLPGWAPFKGHGLLHGLFPSPEKLYVNE